MNDYGGGGGFGGGGGGGGFLPPKAGEKTDQSSYDIEYRTPVTIKSILEARHDKEKDKFFFHDTMLKMVTFVGVIERMEMLSTNVDLVVNDFTSSINVKKFIEADERDYMADDRMRLAPGLFVCVHGTVQESSERMVQAVRLLPVQDFNQFTASRLEAIQWLLRRTRPKPKKDQGGSASMNTSNDVGMYGGVGAPAAADALTGYMKSRTSPSGVPRREMIEALRGSFSEVQVNEAINHLHEEGHLYSTVDDEHFSYCGN